MKNILKEEDDKLGKTINNVNKVIIVCELIGLMILIWSFSWIFTDCGV
tara:strand:- start:539 stop:682 length:144 start_codon:yes stop_codon:yes gene_type:complete